MQIHLATDHAGFAHKEAVKEWLLKEGFAVVDHGAYSHDKQDDFPDFIAAAARAVSVNTQEARGLIFGGSGQGEAMMANRFLGVRAAVFYGGDTSMATLSREHNNANVLSIGARFVDVDLTKQVVWDWLHAKRAVHEKYERRNKKIDQYTKAFYL